VRTCDANLEPVEQIRAVVGSDRADELLLQVMSHSAALCLASHFGLPPGLRGYSASLSTGSGSDIDHRDNKVGNGGVLG
jgi:hypothetical protein